MKLRKMASAAVRNYIRHQRTKLRVKALLESRRPICLEVGAGDKKGCDGWVTLDMTGGCDLYWDLRKGIPFPDGTVAKLYSSHFFEHLTYREGQEFLDECLRVLSPGGSFSICVPDARIYIEAYLGQRDGSKLCGYKPAFNSTTKIDYLNYMAYMDGLHKYMFDEENLLHILHAKGFRNVRTRPFDASLDLKERDFESIYALAEK